LSGARDRLVSFGLLATPYHGAPAIPTQEICGHVHPNCGDERTAEALRYDPKFREFWLRGDQNFPFGFGASSPSNSGFGSRNIARIVLFTCSNLGPFR
jgi:hypothetical protein